MTFVTHKKHQETPKRISNVLGMEFVYIPPGTFMMGSPENEQRRSSNEVLHQVTLTKGFYMQTLPVTVEQWKKFISVSEYAGNGNNAWGCSGIGNPNFSQGEHHPIVCVSWYEAQAFTQWLTEYEGKGFYRLPTEAEWEYVCRAGTQTAFANGHNTKSDGYDLSMEQMGWFKKNSGDKIQPVGQKQPNSWGVFDMHGNVWEWCQDWCGNYPNQSVKDPNGPDKGDDRIIRGGYWDNDAHYCRSAARGDGISENRVGCIGFRLLKESP
jgi:formylglycine-generating enzyme required for sulfatase activity